MGSFRHFSNLGFATSSLGLKIIILRTAISSKQVQVSGEIEAIV